MKNNFLLILFIVLISCGRSGSMDKPVSEKSVSPKRETQKEKTTTTNDVQDFDPNDCVYDQTTQTDEFLKGIPELSNYTWDQGEKTATVIMEDGDSLLIRRGGCMDFGVSAEFRIFSNKVDYKDWSKVFSKIFWIMDLLTKEFDNEGIKKEINKKTHKIQKDLYQDGEDIVTFSDQVLQDQHYEISRIIRKDKTVLKISHYF